MNSLIETNRFYRPDNSGSQTTSNAKLFKFPAIQYQDDIDSFFAQFEDDPDFQAGAKAAGNDIANALYGEDSASLSALRLRAGLTQTELASLIGIHQPALARLESKEPGDPKLSTLKKLSEALGKPLDVVANCFDMD